MMEGSFLRTNQLLASGRHDDALQSLGPRDLLPADPDLFALRALCLLGLHRYREALRDANECLKIDPDHSAGERVRTEALSALGVRPPSKAGSAHDTEDPHAAFMLAREAIEKGDAETGVQYAESVLKAAPGYVPAQCLAAYGRWLATGDPRVLDNLKSQFELDRFSYAGSLLATAEERRGDSARAEQIMRECVEMVPYKLAFRAKLLELLNRRGQHAEVVQLADSLPPEWASDLRVQLAKAVAMASLDQMPEALQIVRPLFDREPTNTLVAQVYLQLLKQDGARWQRFKSISRLFFSTWRLLLQVQNSEKRLKRRRHRSGV